MEDEEKLGRFRLPEERSSHHCPLPPTPPSPLGVSTGQEWLPLLRAGLGRTPPPFGAEFPHNSARDLFGPRKSSCQMIGELVHGCSVKIQATEQRKHFSPQTLFKRE